MHDSPLRRPLRSSLPVCAALRAGLSPRTALQSYFHISHSPSEISRFAPPSAPVSPSAPLPLSHAALSWYAPPSVPVSPLAPAHSLLAALCFRSSGTRHPRSTPLSPGPLRQSLPARRSLSRTQHYPGTHRPPRRSLPPRRLILSLPLSASRGSLPVRATLAPRSSLPALCLSLRARRPPSCYVHNVT